MKTKFENNYSMTHKIKNLEKVNDNFTKYLLKCLWNQKSYLKEKKELEEIRKMIENILLEKEQKVSKNRKILEKWPIVLPTWWRI